MSRTAFTMGREIGEFRKTWTLPVFWLLLFAFPVVLIFGSIKPGAPLWGQLLAIAAMWGPAFAGFIDRATYRVSLFERGIRVRSLLGEKAVALTSGTQIFYKSVRESINGIPAGTRMSLKVFDGKQSMHLRSSIKGIETLNDHMVHFEQEVILPLKRQALLEGQQLSFGKVRLRLGQLVAGSKSISPSEISGIDVRQGRLLVNKLGRNVFTFAQVNLHDIPNMHTLFALLPLLSQPRQDAAQAA